MENPLTLETALLRLMEMDSWCEIAEARDGGCLCREFRKIYCLAGEVALQLGLKLHYEQPDESLSMRGCIPLVLAQCHTVKRILEPYRDPSRAPHVPNVPSSTSSTAQDMESVAKSLSSIRCHLALPRVTLVDISSTGSPSDETSTQVTLTKQPLTVRIAYYPDGGGRKQATREFQHLPDFLDLDDLAISLFEEGNIVVQDFRLKVDGIALHNNNTPQVLSSLHEKGVRKVLLKLEFTGDRIERSEEHHQEKFLVCIDGNIGSRKADFMEKLMEINKQHFYAHVVAVHREPLDRLTKQMGAFFGALHKKSSVSEKDKEHCAEFEKALFQHHLMVATHLRTAHVISERSMQAKVHVFNELNYEEGRLLQGPYDEMLKTYQQKIQGNVRHEPHAVLFFETSVQQALARIKKRERPGEEHQTEEYLNGIETKYDKLYPQNAEHVLRLESDHPMEDLLNTIQNKLPNILKKRSSTSEEELDKFMTFFQDLRQPPDDQPSQLSQSA